MDIWTEILNFTSLFVTPVWNSLIQYIPLVMVALVVVTMLGLVRIWMANTALNRPRVPVRATSGPIPDGVHLPGPSIWPFFLPIAGFFVFLSLVIKPSGTVINPFLLFIGVVIGLFGIAGWFRDAGREWHRTEFGHELIEATVPARIEGPTPPGIHLPGPSGWPFLAPIALLFIFGGLVFGPILIVAGLAMGVMAALGWYLDAGYEFRQVDAGHLAEPRTRDPKRAFPRTAFRVYIGIAVIAIVLTMSPWLLTFLPQSAAGGGAGPLQVGSATPTVSASSAVKFDQSQLLFLANVPITLTVKNLDPTPMEFESVSLRVEKVVVGGGTGIIRLRPLSPGSYKFFDDFHQQTNGVLVVR